MSSPSSANAADVGILAQNQSHSDDASSTEPKFTSRFDVYESIQYGVDYCGNWCYADIADGSTASPALPSIIGLRISGVGNVPLPISEDHANEIKARAEIVEDDKYVIGSGEIKIQHPQWDEKLNKLVETVAYKLGVNPSKLTAELEKLVYMEKGGRIEKVHESYEKMGFLIIQLPSKFTGGVLTIYHSKENDNDGENEESFKFSMGAGEDAMFSCHFACHFSDCEYEMAKLKSGSRVFLCYSLCYKQVGQIKIPTAGMVENATSYFEATLSGLPPADRMVVLSLETNYEGILLANSGINALSHSHRQKAEALKAAGGEFVIVNAKLVHSCSAYSYNHRNVSTIIDIFDDVGNRVNSEMSWLKRSIDFNSFEHYGGMLLAFDDESECVSNWGSCQSRIGGYECSKSTYLATFLVSYDPSYEMELKCLGGKEEVSEFSKRVVETRDYDQLDRLLSVVGVKEKASFDVQSCQKLLRMLLRSRKDVQNRTALVIKILTGLSSSLEPDDLLYNTIIDASQRFGHDGLGEIIRTLLNDDKRKQRKGICFFLKRMDFALKLNKRIGGEAGLDYVALASNDLARASTNIGDGDTIKAVSSIMDMLTGFADIDLTNVVQACLSYFHRGTRHQYQLQMIERARLLKLLLETNKFGPLHSSLAEFASDFTQRAENYCRSGSWLEGESKDMFIQATTFLIQFGTQADYDKFGKYVIKRIGLFSAFINAVMSVSGADLLRDVLNKCFVQYSITEQDTSLYFWTVRKPNEEPIPPTPSLHIQKVIELCPNIVQMMDNDKRLPIHYAAASASVSIEVIMEVLKANNDAASVRDPVTGMFPFQLAASCNNVEASFNLLLANPNLVSGGIKVGDRKRKRSSDA